MAIELITVTTADGVDLDGARYRRPGAGPVRGSVLMVHGLTWNFYRGPSRWLPPLLADAGYAVLSLNMRDHDLAEPKDFELSHHDLRAGVEWLRAHGPGVPVVVAHGFACNKVVCYPGWSGDGGVERYVLTTLGAVKAYRPDIWDTVLTRRPGWRAGCWWCRAPSIRSSRPGLARRSCSGRPPPPGSRSCLLDGANHYFDGRHGELAEAIVGWLGQGQG